MHCINHTYSWTKQHRTGHYAFIHEILDHIDIHLIKDRSSIRLLHTPPSVSIYAHICIMVLTGCGFLVNRACIMVNNGRQNRRLLSFIVCIGGVS